MVHDLSQDVSAPASLSTKTGEVRPRQAVAGLMPPQLGEALIRECWPSVIAYAHGLARLALTLMKTIILAPLGWLILGLLFGRKLSPFICRRYTLTNRRLMVQKGLRPKPDPKQQLLLADIDDVRIVPETVDGFYRAGDLEVISKGQPALRLRGVPEPDSFRHAILNAVRAWVPEKAKGPWQPASAKS